MTNYELKKIDFLGRTVPIIMQNENGPCPLIAMSNVLLLRGKIKIDLDYSRYSFQELNNLIANELMEANASNLQKEDVRAVYEKNIGDAINLLPSLQFGLDVNVKFDRYLLFSSHHQDIDLVHGWVVDEHDPQTHDLMKTITYNHVMEKLVIESKPHEEKKTTEEETPQAQVVIPPTVVSMPSKFQLGPSTTSTTSTTTISTTPTNSTTTTPSLKRLSSPPIEPLSLTPEQKEKVLQEGVVIENFMNKTASQLTYTGLYKLHETLRDNQLCVFFRNNHFSTLFKYKGELYVLMTDSGYMHEPIVWEKLNEVDNDTFLCTSDFKQYEAKLPEVVSSAVSAVSSTLSAVFPNGHEVTAVNAPSDADIQHQLLIEQQIEEEKRRHAEERDFQLAMQLHHEELKKSQEANVPAPQQQRPQPQQVPPPESKPPQQKPKKNNSCVIA